MTAPSVPRSGEQRLLGGISSAFRINPFTGAHLEVRSAHGATLETTDGRTYIDMFMAHGSTVLGHAHPAVMAAIRDTLDDGVVIGYETPLASSSRAAWRRRSRPLRPSDSSRRAAKRWPHRCGSHAPTQGATS